MTWEIISNLTGGIEYLIGYPWIYITIWSIIWCFFSKSGGIGALLRICCDDLTTEIKLIKWRLDNIKQ